jgi:hypothetical protein
VILCPTFELENIDPESGRWEIKRDKDNKERTVDVENGTLGALRDWLAIRGHDPDGRVSPGQ